MLVDFGLGEVLQRKFQDHCELLRGSGRTEQLLEMVREGDVVVFYQTAERERFDQELKRRKVEGVKTLTSGNHDPQDIFNLMRGTPKGRVFFDHCWIENYYRGSLIYLQETLDRMQQDLSGYWRAHLETRNRAEASQRGVPHRRPARRPGRTRREF